MAQYIYGYQTGEDQFFPISEENGKMLTCIAKTPDDAKRMFDAYLGTSVDAGNAVAKECNPDSIDDPRFLCIGFDTGTPDAD